MRFITAGESHGPAMTAIVEGIPAGVVVSRQAIDDDLARRQSGYGRGGRQRIEKDTVEVSSGIRFGVTLGTPIALRVENADHASWAGRMDIWGQAPEDLVREVTPRPGHADLVGCLKTGSDDCRDVLERSSARETAARVAAGAIAKAFLASVGVNVSSYVTRIGRATFAGADRDYSREEVESSPVRCPDERATEEMCREIDRARKEGQSLGGWYRLVVSGLVPGLGSYRSGRERLTSRLGAAVFAIPAIKSVEFGMGKEAGCLPGGQVHDEITYTPGEGYGRRSNNAGGLEGGMTTGQPLVMTICMKPIPTMTSPLSTVNMDTFEVAAASKERSDVCAVPACAVVAEAEIAMVLADAYLDKFGHDDMADIRSALDAYRARIVRPHETGR